MKKTLFLIIALAGTLSLRAEENDLLEDEKFDLAALEKEIISQEAQKANSNDNRKKAEDAEAEELMALLEGGENEDNATA